MINKDFRLLKDKVCVIVGAASTRSIGYATAELFAHHGAKIVILDIAINEEKNKELQSEILTKVGFEVDLLCIQCDIVDVSACENAIQKIISHYGQIDCLINSAGIVKSNGILDINMEQFDLMIDINLKGTFNTSQAVLKIFEKQNNGVIVNLASVAAQRGGGLVGGAHYAASKGGVVSLTKAIAREFGAKGIRANVICPSMTETGMLDGNISNDAFNTVISNIPLKRAGKPIDIANACLFLASDLSAYITGHTLDVNGGSHIH
jgi:NAD(P)-dependent dehydrogenase (short-subunit alcohol dehydrogenase family)